jgi:exopolysaccharide production protein ExoZ
MAIPARFYLWGGGFGVALFFMISGFIMVVTSWNEFGTEGAARNFMYRRLTRIVPLYWFVTTLAVVGVFFIPSMLKVPVLESSYVVGSYLFWPVERVNGLVRPIANLGWTLNLEMFFYIIFAVALFFGRMRGLLLVMLAIGGLSVIQSLGVFAKQGQFPSVALNFWGDPIVLNFIVGMLVGVVYRQGLLLRSGVAGALIVLSAVATVVFGYTVYGLVDPLPEDHILRRLTYAAPAIPLLIGAALGPQIIGSSLLARTALLIGNASYSLYLIHPFVLRPMQKVWGKVIGAALPESVFVPVCIFAALAAGLILYFVVERPATNYFGKKRNSYEPPRAMAAAE